MNKPLTLILASLCVPLLLFGQPSERTPQPDATDYVFRFVPGTDMFYVPWGGNAASLEALLSAVSGYMEPLRNGERYICVSSYGATANDTLTSARMAYLRCQRVKSELILRGDIAESMFVTDRAIVAPYDGLRNVVVVTFPASVEQVAAIAGEEAAARVEAYNREISGEAEAERLAAERAEQAARERAETERLAAERAAREKAERLAAEQSARERAEAERLAAERAQAGETALLTAEAKPYCLALRTNLLQWATLTPNIGLEWRIDPNWSVQANVAYTYWSWSSGDRRYSVLDLSPEVRRYLGATRRGYIGLMGQFGNFNYKFSQTGKQGDFYGVGIVGGYQLPVGRCLTLDFGAGIGYVHADYDKYRRIAGYNVRSGSGTKNYFGLNRLTVGLVWTFGGNKGGHK